MKLLIGLLLMLISTSIFSQNESESLPENSLVSKHPNELGKTSALSNKSNANYMYLSYGSERIRFIEASLFKKNGSHVLTIHNPYIDLDQLKKGNYILVSKTSNGFFINKFSL